MLANVKITHTEGVFCEGTLHPPGTVLAVSQSVAQKFVQSGKGEILPSKATGTVIFDTDNPYREAVDPLVPNADPLHAARMGSAQVEEHPGLLALADAGHPGAPKRAGRLVPEAVATTTTEDPKPVAKSAKS